MTSDRDEGTGRFLPGNSFWRARSSAGPKPKFAEPEELWAACAEYFEWVESNPLLEGFQYQGKVSSDGLPKMRAMTIKGLCVFLDIALSTWDEWRKSRPDLSEVITRVEQIIDTQKIEGAAAGMLNPTIVARVMGLPERTEMSGPDGKPIQTEDASARDIILGKLNGIAASIGTGDDTSEPD